MTSKKRLVHRLLKFIDNSPTSFHAVKSSKDILLANGFQPLHESYEWKLSKGGRYFVTRDSSAIIAFIVGSDILSHDARFRIVAAHCDSPGLKLKPKPHVDKYGLGKLSVEPYGGLLLNSWLNRDLGIAGRLITRDSLNMLQSRLFYIKESIFSIPQLAIHLNPNVNDGLAVDKQTQTMPITGIFADTIASQQAFEKRLLHAAEVYSTDRIISFDISLCDIQPASIGGLDGKLIFAPRLDNLVSCFVGLESLVSTVDPRDTCVLVCYDNEEVGNLSARGADSFFLRDVLSRVLVVVNPAGLNVSQDIFMAFSRSFCISSDMAHATHPHYLDKHEPNHVVQMGKGPVIKSNANQRYATTGYSSAVFANLCDQASVPYQYFVARSNMGCGSTVGPTTSAILGIPTVDIGNPMLSMHSVREVSCVSDLVYLKKAFVQFYNQFSFAVLDS